MPRVKTNRIHIDKDGTVHPVTRRINTERYFIKGTDIEVTGKTCHRKYKPLKFQTKEERRKSRSNYDFSKPFFAQGLGSEWDDYAWSGSDF